MDDTTRHDGTAGTAATEGAGGFPCTEEGCGFVGQSERGLRRHRTNRHGADPVGHRPRAGESAPTVEGGQGSPDAGEQIPGGEPAPPLGHPEEQRPRHPKSWRDWLKRETRKKRVREKVLDRAAKGPRVPLADGIGWAYSYVGANVFGRSGDMRLIPVGRVMELQAATVGQLADAMVTGTIVDKVLQPIVQRGQDAKQLGQLVGLPAMTLAATLKPELLQVLQDDQGHVVGLAGPLAIPYADALATSLEATGEAVQLKEEQRQQRMAKIAATNPWVGQVAADGHDPIAYMVAQLFMPPPNAAPAPAPGPEAANGAGRPEAPVVVADVVPAPGQPGA